MLVHSNQPPPVSPSFSQDQQVGVLRRTSAMLPRRLMGCLRLATVGSRAERLAFFRTSIATGGDRFSSTTSSAGRTAHGESHGYKGNRRAPAVDGSSVSGGRHITSTAVSIATAVGRCFHARVAAQPPRKFWFTAVPVRVIAWRSAERRKPSCARCVSWAARENA